MRIRLMKQTLACLLALLMLLALSACGDQKGETLGPGEAGKTDSDMKRSTTVTVDGVTTESTDYTYTILSGNTVRLDRIFNLQQEQTIPEAVDGMTVTVLGRTLLRDELMNNTTIRIPDCVTTLEGNPFDCGGPLKEIVVSAGHPTLEVVDGVLFSKPDHRLVCAFNHLPGSYETPAVYTVPEGTETIEDHAFRFAVICWGTIRIPNSVTTLGKNPFAFCNSDLVYGTLGISVAEDHPTLEIVDGMLFSKPDHRLVCYADPNANKSEDGELITFRAIPEGTEVIDDFAFMTNGVNSRLNTVRIPVSVKSVGTNPFFCMDLEEIQLDAANPALEVVDGLLYSKADQRVVASIDRTQNDYTVQAGTKTVGDYAFCRSHTEQWNVSLPEGLTEIGDRAFCEALSCNIPSSVQRIGCYAFNCYGWDAEKIDLVFDRDIDICACAFCGTTGYSAIQSLTVTGSGRVDIHPGAFSMCRGLSKVRIEAGETRVGDGAFSDSSLEEAVFGEGLLSLGERTFFMCEHLDRLVLPASLTRIVDLLNKSTPEYDAVTDTYRVVYSCSADVIVQPNSYAERFCQENGISCRTDG